MFKFSVIDQDTYNKLNDDDENVYAITSTGKLIKLTTEYIELSDDCITCQSYEEVADLEKDFPDKILLFADF